jgi:phage terminase large subunit GpA-like protein
MPVRYVAIQKLGVAMYARRDRGARAAASQNHAVTMGRADRARRPARRARNGTRATPYIVEPLDNMGPDSPVNKQSIRKSAQTGFSVMAIVGVGHSIDCDPAGGIMLVQPTQDALDKFIRDKFNPAIENTPALKAKVAPQVRARARARRRTTSAILAARWRW